MSEFNQAENGKLVIDGFEIDANVVGVTKSNEKLDQVMFEDFKRNLQEEIQLDQTKAAKSKVDIEQAVYDYLNGEEDAFDYIYSHYRPVLDRLGVRKQDDDLSQELSIVLYNAVQRFDILAGVKFNTFFWTCAQNHIGTQNIRRGAQKRSGAQKVETTVVNEETGETEVVIEVLKTKVVSLQSTLKNKDSETEVSNFVENNLAKLDYKKSNLDMSLAQISESGLINEKEMTAIKMVVQGATLAEIGQVLGNITAPAVHVMLRRLGKKKQVGNYLREILSNS